MKIGKKIFEYKFSKTSNVGEIIYFNDGKTYPFAITSSTTYHETLRTYIVFYNSISNSFPFNILGLSELEKATIYEKVFNRKYLDGIFPFCKSAEECIMLLEYLYQNQISLKKKI